MLTREEVEARLLQKAASDPQFRTELISNPAAAIQRAFGVAVPLGTRVTVLEEKPDQHYIVLPLNPETGALGAAQLDAVSGGDLYPCYGEPVQN